MARTTNVARNVLVAMTEDQYQWSTETARSLGLSRGALIRMILDTVMAGEGSKAAESVAEHFASRILSTPSPKRKKVRK